MLGAYEFVIDYPFVGGETIRVFWHSAEDGSPTDVVSVPARLGRRPYAGTSSLTQGTP